MELWRYHQILSSAIGDSARTDPQFITDGVRFSREERNNYLYRAAIEVINKRLLALKIKTPTEANKYAYSYFPTSIRQQSFQFYTAPNNERRLRINLNNVRIAYIFTAQLLLNGMDNELETIKIPIIVRPHTEFNEKHSDIFKHEDYLSLEYSNNDNISMPTQWVFVIQNRPYIDTQKDLIELVFIETPPKPFDLRPMDYFKIDEMHINEVIAHAIHYMLIDHQDIEISPQFIQEYSNINNILIQLQGMPEDVS